MLVNRFTAGLIGIAIVLVITSSALGADPKTVQDKTYDVWVSQSFASPPFTPFHDCISFTTTQMCSAACGECGTLNELNLGKAFGQSLFTANISCGGLNLVYAGSSVDGKKLPAGLDAIGGVIVGGQQGTSFGFEGLASGAACSLAGHTALGKASPYGSTKTVSVPK